MSQRDLTEILNLTASEVWHAVRNQRILISGGTGFVGKWLLEALVHANARLSLGLRVSVLSRQPQSMMASCPHLAAAPGVSWVSGDITESGWIAPAFDLAIHAALPVAQPGEDESSLVELARQGARQMCGRAQASGARRVLHVSSGAVYAGIESSVLSETMRWNEARPANAYTRAKRAAETEFSLSWPFETVIARCFSFMGPYLRATSGTAAAMFAESARTSSPIEIHGDGTAIRSYQYASDMARWLLTILVLGKSGEAYNVGHESPVSIRQLADAFSAASMTNLAVQTQHRPVVGLAGVQYLPDVRKARDNLGLFNQVGLDEGARRTLVWHGEPTVDSAVE